MRRRPKTSCRTCGSSSAATTDAIEQTGAWLFRVAKNRIVDRARKKREEPLPAAEDEEGRTWLEENLPDPAAGPMRPMPARFCSTLDTKWCLLTPPEQRATCRGARDRRPFVRRHVRRDGACRRTPCSRAGAYAVMALRARLQAEYGDLIVRRTRADRLSGEDHAHLSARLIAIGAFALLKHYGFIDHAFLQVFWPCCSSASARPLVRPALACGHAATRCKTRWERRMHRHFGPGWTNLSEERERFRAGMRQWRSHRHGGDGDSSAPPSASSGLVPTPSASTTRVPGELR